MAKIPSMKAMAVMTTTTIMRATQDIKAMVPMTPTTNALMSAASCRSVMRPMIDLAFLSTGSLTTSPRIRAKIFRA